MKGRVASDIKGSTCMCACRRGSDAPHCKRGFMNSSRSHLAHITSRCVRSRGETAATPSRAPAVKYSSPRPSAAANKSAFLIRDSVGRERNTRTGGSIFYERETTNPGRS